MPEQWSWQYEGLGMFFLHVIHLTFSWTTSFYYSMAVKHYMNNYQADTTTVNYIPKRTSHKNHPIMELKEVWILKILIHAWSKEQSWVATHMLTRNYGKVFPTYAMKAYRRRKGTAPLIHNLSTRWRWLVRLTPQLFYAGGKGPGTHWTANSVGPRSGLNIWKKRNISCLNHIACSLSTMLTMLSCWSMQGKERVQKYNWWEWRQAHMKEDKAREMSEGGCLLSSLFLWLQSLTTIIKGLK